MGNKSNTLVLLAAVALIANAGLVFMAGGGQTAIIIAAISVVGVVCLFLLKQSIAQEMDGPVGEITGRINDALADVDSGEWSSVDSPALEGPLASAGQSLNDLLAKFKDTVGSQTSENNKLSTDAARFGTAVSAANTHVMIADENYDIIYVNDSLKQMLTMHQAALAQHFPGFNIATLLGTNIDTFHKVPSHQRGILDNLTTNHSSEISVGDLIFGLSISPVFNQHKQRVGTVVEWLDLSERAEAERMQVENLRISTALGSVSTNVMLADPNYDIIYLNDSLKEMMRKYLTNFQALRGDFDPDALIGLNIDTFHKNPGHQRNLLDGLTGTYKTEINLGELSFALTANPVIDGDGNRLGTTLEWEDITAQKQAEIVAKENARIRVALDGVTTNVMVADGGNNIVYMNQSVLDMLRNAADDIRKDLPNFDPNNLIGKNIDQFHKKPEHQRGMLEKLQSAYRTRIVVGGRHFNLIASPVNSETGERLGTVVEWDDVTAQVTVEKEVEKLVTSVSQGNLGALISTEGKDGFFLNISNGLNDLSQTVNAFVRDISVAMQRLAEGDLRVQIENDYQGMFGDVKNALNETVDKLSEVLANVKMATDSIRASNHEISIGNDQLSERTEKQASNLEETAASLEELTSNVRSTADNATTANTAAGNAKEQAKSGEAIVTEAVQSMTAITESSNKIVEIISVIDDIAFQTNLLALNASVEAARAGEQGRGFAVVANEVRNLAQRSAVSAKEIKELIDDSSQRVNTGSDQVNKCGEALSDILNHVGELTTLISDIANSTNEQAAGIGQVNQAVAELDDITQQNAALAEEASSASQSSVQQADDMVEIVSFFQLDDSLQTAAPAASIPAAPRAPAAPRPAPKPKVKAQATEAPKTVSIKADDSDDDWEEF